MERFLHIRTQQGGYLRCAGEGDDAVTADGAAPREWETFSMITSDPPDGLPVRPLTSGMRVRVGVWRDGMWLYASGGRVSTTIDGNRPDGLFTIVVPGKPELEHFGEFALRAMDGHYLVPDRDTGRLRASAPGPERAGIFVAEFHPVPGERRPTRLLKSVPYGDRRWILAGDLAPDTAPAGHPLVGGERGLAVHSPAGYLQAGDGGGGAVSGKGLWPREWETFVFLAADRAAQYFPNGASVQVMTWNGRYLRAAGGVVRADGDGGPHPEQTFTVQMPGDQESLRLGEPFVLRCHDGGYLSVAENGQVSADAPEPGPAETFVLENSQRPRPNAPLPPRTPIGRHYWALGGPAGPLGMPTCFYSADPGGEIRAATGEGLFLRYQGGWIYWSPDIGAHAVPTGPVLSTWQEHKAEAGELGFPIDDGNPTPGGRLHGFTNGHIHVSAERDRATVVRGAFRRCWLDLGGISGPLGAPRDDEQEVRLDSSASFRYQWFAGGLIVQDSGRDPVASDLAGAILPHQRYRLVLEHVTCEKPAAAGGTDDVWLRVATTAPASLRDGTATTWGEWRDRYVDPGQSPHPVGTVLYQGPLPDSLIITLLGLGVDAPWSTEDLFTSLAGAVAEQPYLTPAAPTEVDPSRYPALVAGTVVGSLAGLLACATSGPLLAAHAVDLSRHVLGADRRPDTVADSLPDIWRRISPPDPLLAERACYNARKLREVLAGGEPPPDRGDWAEVLPGLGTRVTYRRTDEGDLLETREYANTARGSRYALTLRHHCEPLPLGVEGPPAAG